MCRTLRTAFCASGLLSVVALLLAAMHLSAAEPAVAAPFYLHSGERVLFLGDSNTQNGGYIHYLDAFLFTRFPDQMFELINLGLASETVCGLSEPDHPFPRPNVLDRLDSALAKIHPDVVVACYGINDGIYYPFSQERFEKFQAGMRKLIERVKASGARLTLLTPWMFDVQPVEKVALPDGAEKYSWVKPYKDYDKVLDRYSDWLLSLRSKDLQVIDVHRAEQEYLATARKLDPKYQMSADGVHVDASGHWIVAQTLLEAWHAPETPIDIAALYQVHPIGTEHRMIRSTWNTSVAPPIDTKCPAHLAEIERTFDRLNYRCLRVTGLSQGAYALFDGEQHLGNASAAELAAGVNLLRFSKCSMTARSHDMLDLVVERSKLLGLAWLHEVGFKRPGTPEGRPLAEAKEKAKELDVKIRKLCKPIDLNLRLEPAK